MIRKTLNSTSEVEGHRLQFLNVILIIFIQTVLVCGYQRWDREDVSPALTRHDETRILHAVGKGILADDEPENLLFLLVDWHLFLCIQVAVVLVHSCPSEHCSCTRVMSKGYNVTCGNLHADTIRSELQRMAFEEISIWRLTLKLTRSFYVAEDILGGVQIPEVVILNDNHYENPLNLFFHRYAFSSRNGYCTLTKSIIIDGVSSYWYVRQFNAGIFKHCHRLRKVQVVANIDAVIRFPADLSLDLLYINDQSRRWSEFEWDTSLSTRTELGVIKNLTLRGDHLTDESIKGWFNERTFWSVKLIGNFSAVPDLSGIPKLNDFEIHLDQGPEFLVHLISSDPPDIVYREIERNISLMVLPPRLKSLRIVSPFRFTRLEGIQGKIYGANINLDFALRNLDSSVFLPILNDGNRLYLNGGEPSYRFISSHSNETVVFLLPQPGVSTADAAWCGWSKTTPDCYLRFKMVSARTASHSQNSVPANSPAVSTLPELAKTRAKSYWTACVVSLGSGFLPLDRIPELEEANKFLQESNEEIVSQLPTWLHKYSHEWS